MPFDAILIPGGGVTAEGAPTPWVLARLERARELLGDAIAITLSAGTVHKPAPLDGRGFPILESVAGANYLRQRGVPADQVMVETCSLDTIGNAYFSRMIHAEPRKLRRILVITSQFHLPRTEAIFRGVYGLPDDARGTNFDLEFLATPNAGLTPGELLARTEREQASLTHWLSLAPSFRDLADFHRWLFTEHGAYAVGRVPRAETGIARSTY